MPGQGGPPAGYHEVAAPTPVSEQQPESNLYSFGKDVGRGMGFDVDKVERMETDPSGAKHPLMGGLELARQLLKQAGPWMEAVAKDPFHIADPIHAMASNVTSASGLPDKPGEQFQAPNAGKLLGAGAMVLGGTDKLPAGEYITAASKLLDRQIALNKGRVGLVNDARNAALKLDNTITGETGEVGRHAQAVIAADKADLTRTQSTGKVDTTGATLAGQAVRDKTKLGGVAGGYETNIPMDSAKALITQLGREASRLERTGKAPEAAGVWAEYDALRKATQDRANALGADYSRSWTHYIKEFHNYIQLKKGVFGDLLENPNHTSVLDKLTGGDVAAQIPEIKQWFKKYNIDPEPLNYALDQGAKLNELNKQTGNMFIGKIRAIMKHPVLAGSAAAGAAVAGHASGVPGLGFVLPLIVAGKVAGVLDASEMTKLLREIHKKVGPEMERVTPEPQGPQPVPQSPQTPMSATSSLATKYGLNERPPSAPGLVSFQDVQTGASIEMREGFTEQELADRVAEKRQQIPVEDLHPALASKVARARKARGKE